MEYLIVESTIPCEFAYKALEDLYYSKKVKHVGAIDALLLRPEKALDIELLRIVGYLPPLAVISIDECVERVKENAKNLEMLDLKSLRELARDLQQLADTIQDLQRNGWSWREEVISMAKEIIPLISKVLGIKVDVNECIDKIVFGLYPSESIEHGIMGLYHSEDDKDTIRLRVTMYEGLGSRIKRKITVAHELVHMVMRRSAPEAIQDIWFVEGMAMFLSRHIWEKIDPMISKFFTRYSLPFHSYEPYIVGFHRVSFLYRVGGSQLLSTLSKIDMNIEMYEIIQKVADEAGRKGLVFILDNISQPTVDLSQKTGVESNIIEALKKVLQVNI